MLDFSDCTRTGISKLISRYALLFSVIVAVENHNLLQLLLCEIVPLVLAVGKSHPYIFLCDSVVLDWINSKPTENRDP